MARHVFLLELSIEAFDAEEARKIARRVEWDIQCRWDDLLQGVSLVSAQEFIKDFADAIERRIEGKDNAV